MDVDRQEDASMFNEGDAKGEPVHESGALHDDTDPILPRNKPPFAKYEYDVEAQMIGTMVSWVIPYRGNLHKELWDHISRMYRNGQERMCAVVQSSGTGKSRMVDELGKERFVIPICVRKGSSGFPPPDEGVRNYLLYSMTLKAHPRTPWRSEFNEAYATDRVDAFFQALFATVESEVEQIRQQIVGDRPIAGAPNDNVPDLYVKVAKEFRLQMTARQHFLCTNAYRTRLYTKVLRRAGELMEEADPKAKKPTPLDPLGAGTALVQKLNSLKPSSDIAFIVAFDEAAALNTPGREHNPETPFVFETLRQRLNSLGGLPFFSLFISTSPSIAMSLSSNRIVKAGGERPRVCPAFAGCIFDEFSDSENVVFAENKTTVQQAAMEWTMMHLGRSLWASRIDLWKRNELKALFLFASGWGEACDARAKQFLRRGAMRFAVAKLLNWPTASLDKWAMKPDEMIACLCARLPIEFENCSPLQHKFVESHMRICLIVNPDEQSMVCLSSSEPVLAEAAFIGMKNCVIDILDALKVLLAKYSVNRDDRGELVVLLILLLARDQAICENNEEAMWKYPRLMDISRYLRPPERPRHPVEPNLIEWNRVLTVPEYLRSLVGEIVEIQDDIDRLLESTRMHFNHFIRSADERVLQSQYLAAFLMRGAALRCPSAQLYVDAAIPFSTEDVIGRFTTSSILIRVKNSADYDSNPIWELFDEMEQYSLGIVDRERRYLPPVVRIVFALAASHPSVKGRIEHVQVADGKSYVAVDIWCAGVSVEKLPCIRGTWDPVRHPHRANWNSLLALSQGWMSRYVPPGGKDAKGYLQNMTPCAADDPSFWQFSPELLEDKEYHPALFPHVAEVMSRLEEVTREILKREADSEAASDPGAESGQASTSNEQAKM